MIRIEVEGRPAPQGSKHRGAHGQMREASPYLPAWRAAVRNTAHRTLNALGVPPEVRPHFRGAVVVRRLEFVTHPGQRVDSPPDLDKLLRAVLDALKYAGVFEDDGRVVRVEHISKRHPTAGEPLGCVIELDSLQGSEIEMPGTKLYRLVLEEVEVNGSAPVVVGQVVGDAAMVESVLPALARRLVPNEPVAPTGTAYVHIDPAPPAEPAAIPPAAAAPAEAPKRRGRPSKAELERRAAAEAAAQGAAAPIVQQPAAPAAPAAYDPFAAVAGAAQ